MKLGTFVLKLPGDIGKIIVSKMQSTFCTNVPLYLVPLYLMTKPGSPEFQDFREHLLARVGIRD